MLKHDAVLYAAQEYGVECDGGSPVMVFFEEPELPVPQGFVDPLPAFFERMAALVESLRGFGDAEVSARIDLLADFVGRLRKLARKAADGQPYTKKEDEWVFGVGRALEELFLAHSKDETLFFGADQGRQARGVTLTADIYTNVQRMEVLQLGLGLLMDLYVVVPASVGSVVTQGGLHSLHVFRQPIGERLTDEAWFERVKAGERSRPAWTASFVEE